MYYTAYKYLYHVKKVNLKIRILQVHIKYGTKQVIEITNENYKIFISNDCLFLVVPNIIHVFGKYILTLPIMVPCVKHLSKISILERYLWISTYHVYDYNTIVYDLEHKIVIHNENKNFHTITFSPNGRLLCRNEKNFIFNSVDDMFNLHQEVEFEAFDGQLLWRNDAEIIGFNNNNGDFIRLIFSKNSVKEIRCEPINLFDNYTAHLTRDDIVICIHDKRIVVIDDISFREVKNKFDIQFYNHFYDIFIDQKLKMYKIVDNKFERFNFEYDLLRDNDQPKYLHYVIDVFLDLFLFPIEICNVIYQQLITA